MSPDLAHASGEPRGHDPWSAKMQGVSLLQAWYLARDKPTMRNAARRVKRDEAVKSTTEDEDLLL